MFYENVLNLEIAQILNLKEEKNLATKLTFDKVIEKAKPNTSEVTLSNSQATTIIPNQGFSLTSLWRGILGMASLIFISFLVVYVITEMDF